MNDLLKLYTNPTWVDSDLSYSPLLFPFWGTRLKKSTPFISEVWKRYVFDASYYAVTSEIHDADAILLPHNYWLLKQKRPERLSATLRDAERLQKPIVIDAYGDSDAEIPVKNAVILRTSQYRHRLKPYEIMIPAYAEDLQELHPTSAREKSPVPIVGFAGWAEVSRNAKIKTFCFRLFSAMKPHYMCHIPGVVFRKQSLAALASSSRITTNFLVRKSYSGHAKTLQGNPKTLRAEFIENIAASDYTLNIKGNGNYSQRFYETLSLRRVPLLLDTECVLPLESFIDYRECCLIVNYQDIDRIGEIVAEFHDSLSSDRFLQMQQRAREIFETYLRVDVFTKYLAQELRKRLVTEHQSKFRFGEGDAESHPTPPA